jgi:type I restriction enzyme S subunit
MKSDAWLTVTFRELIQSGMLQIGDGYRAKNEELGGDGPIFLRAGQVTDATIDFNDVERFHAHLADRVASKMARPGDAVVTTKGNSTGRVTFVREGLPPFVYSPHLSYWRSCDHTQLVPQFLYYWSRTKEFKTQLHGMSASTDMAPYLSLSDQRRLRITLPPVEHQRAVAHIVGTLDDKIELNRRMNEALEAMARALFKSWFVDFEPVRAKAEGRQPTGMDAETAALFPETFVDSLLGKIPKGWRVGCIGDVAKNPRRGVDPSEVESTTPYIGLEQMPRKSIALSGWGRTEDLASNKFRFRQGEILFGKLRPYFHKVGVAAVDGVCSTDILVVTPQYAEWFSVVLGHLSSEEFVNHADATSTGTKMPRTNWSDMARFEIVIPERRVAQRLTEHVSEIVGAIRSNILQSRTLAAVRDALVPKLLSGELRVTDMT